METLPILCLSVSLTQLIKEEFMFVKSRVKLSSIKELHIHRTKGLLKDCFSYFGENIENNLPFKFIIKFIGTLLKTDACVTILTKTSQTSKIMEAYRRIGMSRSCPFRGQKGPTSSYRLEA